MRSLDLPLFALVLVICLTGTGCTEEQERTEPSAGDSIAAGAPTTDIVIAPLTGTGDDLEVGRIEPITHRAGYDNQPVFTEDSRHLLWTSIRGNQSDVYRRQVEGNTSPRRVTTTPESEYSPSPGPGGDLHVVRVESDGRQRLWRYSQEGDPLDPVLAESDSVGYYAWLDPSRVATFVLGEPAKLHVTNVPTGADTVVASGIGRSLQAMPDKPAVSFVRVAADSTTSIHVVVSDDDGVSTQQLTRTPGDGTGVDHAWTPNGSLLMAAEDSLWTWRRERGDWHAVRGLNKRNLSRLAVAPSGKWLALVDQR